MLQLQHIKTVYNPIPELSAVYIVGLRRICGCAWEAVALTTIGEREATMLSASHYGTILVNVPQNLV